MERSEPVSPETEAAVDPRLTRAKAYPYARPPHSYLFVGGAARPLAAPSQAALDIALAEVGAAPLAERVAVIAHGSNAAPEALARKYDGFAGDPAAPVIRARLEGFDVVYATHFSSYGSIPSTLAPSPGTVVETAVTLLAPDQLALMHETELSAGNYVFGRLDGLALDLDGLGRRETAFAYVTRRGCLGIVEGAPLALAQIAARGRRFAAAQKIAVLRLARDYLAPGADLDRFLLRIIEDAAYRRECAARLARHALGGPPPGFVPLEAADGAAGEG